MVTVSTKIYGMFRIYYIITLHMRIMLVLALPPQTILLHALFHCDEALACLFHSNTSGNH